LHPDKQIWKNTIRHLYYTHTRRHTRLNTQLDKYVVCEMKLRNTALS